MTELLNSLPTEGLRPGGEWYMPSAYMYTDMPISTRAAHTTYTVTTNIRSQTDSFNVGRDIR